MSIVLNHTVVRTSDRDAGARFFAELLDLQGADPTGPFVPVRVNEQLTLDFDQRHDVVAGHFGFLVDDVTFNQLLEPLQQRPEVPFGSGPEHGWDRAINHIAEGRGVYVGDPDGDSYEFFTTPPD